MRIQIFFDADADPGYQNEADPCRSGSGSTTLLESLIKENILSQLVENRLLRNNQHGFLTGKVLYTNLLVFQEHVTKAVDKGRPMDIIFLDFSEAFNMVP
jgi:hypothetical protein